MNRCSQRPALISTWVLFAATRGFFSLVALITPFVLLAAAITAAISIAPVRRTCVTRKTMADAGLSIDF